MCANKGKTQQNQQKRFRKHILKSKNGGLSFSYLNSDWISHCQMATGNITLCCCDL